VRVIAPEAPDGPATRALYAEYQGLVRERLGPGFVASPEIFATEEDFDGRGAVWLVVREDGQAVACGGLRPRGAGDGEIKRMFVTAAARGRGHGRALLEELEGRAREAGYERVLLYTTEVLGEARALYHAAGYRPVGVTADGGRIDLWLAKRL
jgi:GNAT superfamily N-acetyltransferase